MPVSPAASYIVVRDGIDARIPTAVPSPPLGYLTPRDVFNPRPAPIELKLKF